MGKNKLAKFEELTTFKHVFQVPSREIVAGKKFPLKGKWHTDFFQNQNPILLELGCGKGEYTVALAQRYPQQNFIGIDIKGARLWTGAKQALQLQLPNVAFIRTDIEMIHHFFAPDEVEQIWLTFPDPQMKKTTKRLTSTNFIQKYQQFLKKKHQIHLKTDSNFMYSYTQEMIKANNYTLLNDIEDIYQDPNNQQNILGIKTYYEQQWLERGLTIKYIAFRADQQAPYTEPNIDHIPLDSYRSFKRDRRIQNHQKTIKK